MSLTPEQAEAALWVMAGLLTVTTFGWVISNSSWRGNQSSDGFYDRYKLMQALQKRTEATLKDEVKEKNRYRDMAAEERAQTVSAENSLIRLNKERVELKESLVKAENEALKQRHRYEKCLKDLKETEEYAESLKATYNDFREEAKDTFATIKDNADSLFGDYGPQLGRGHVTQAVERAESMLDILDPKSRMRAEQLIQDLKNPQCVSRLLTSRESS